MTKYILHGGGENGFNDLAKKYLDSKMSGKKILILYQAKKYSFWEKIFSIDKKILIDIGVEEEYIEMGSKEISILEVQIKNADYIVIKGGSSGLLKRRMYSLKNKIPELFQEKIIIAVSAGCYLISSKYYSNDKNKIQNGFGILNIATICHYQDDLKIYYKELQKLFGKQTYKIPEFKVIEIDKI